MTTHDFVYQTFVLYIFLKSLIFFPLVWVACVLWWAERKKNAIQTVPSTEGQPELAPPLSAAEPLLH